MYRLNNLCYITISFLKLFDTNERFEPDIYAISINIFYEYTIKILHRMNN